MDKEPHAMTREELIDELLQRVIKQSTVLSQLNVALRAMTDVALIITEDQPAHKILLEAGREIRRLGL